MAKRAANSWGGSPRSQSGAKLSDATKALVQARGDALVAATLKPMSLSEPPADPVFSYIVDLYNLWNRNFFYFCATYRCPMPDCVSEFYEVRYARLVYAGNDSYNLAYMRHTGKWEGVFEALTLDDALEMVATNPIFWP